MDSKTVTILLVYVEERNSPSMQLLMIQLTMKVSRTNAGVR